MLGGGQNPRAVTINGKFKRDLRKKVPGEREKLPK